MQNNEKLNEIKTEITKTKVKLKLSDLKLSIQLLGTIALGLLFGNFMPEALQASFYAISCSLKNILLFILPVVIFVCVFSCLTAFRNSRTLKLMLGLLAVTCISNYIATLIAYGVGSLGLINFNVHKINEITTQTQALQPLLPLWELTLPNWISNGQALILGFILGSWFSFFPNQKANWFGYHAKRWVTFFLEKIFVPILPIFSFGFILKMQYDGILGQVVKSYLPLVLVVLIAYTIYLAFLFFVAAGFNFNRWLNFIKNMLPVGLVAFSTMSSMATMPVTLKAAEKNTANPDVAQIVIPATVNIHMVGVAIAVPLMAFFVLANFGYELPSLTMYLGFALYFILAQFSVAAVPGGAILAILPTLETYLGFSGEMSALITALYILFDPFVTVTNVLGNSALAIMVAKIFKQTGSNV